MRAGGCHGGACFTKEVAGSGYAGGMYANAVDSGYLVDCTITNCVGQRGAATYYGTMVRCFVTECWGVTKGAASYRGNAINCVVAHIPVSIGACFVQSSIVNCTLDDISPSVQSEGPSRAYNILCTVSSGKAGDASSVSAIGNVFATNCVFSKGLSWADKGYCTLADAHNCNIDAARVQFVSPMFNDYRLLPESDAVNAGDASLLAEFTVPEGIDLYKDFHGNPIPQTGAIHAGALQETYQPRGGLVFFANQVRMVGGAAGKCGYAYAHAVTYPEQWHLYSASTDRAVYCFDCDNATQLGLRGSRRFPEMDEGLWLMPPPAGLVMTNRTRFAVSELYVDPTADAAAADGSAEKPYRTLQAAVDATPDLTYTVIHAAAGEYREGYGVGGGFTNRVSVSSAKRVRIKGAGSGKSAIYGELDTTSDNRGADGRGAHAMRCAALESGLLQGFTLAGGRSAYEGNTSDDMRWTQGGCVWVSGVDASIADCIVTNGAAWRGGAMMNGRAYRCRFVDCWGGNGVTRYTYFYSCQFDHMANSSAAVIGSNAHAFHCSVSAANGNACDATNIDGFNNILSRPATASPLESGTLKDGTMNCGNALYRFGKIGIEDSSSYVAADPAFVDDVNDLRVLTSSPAMGFGDAENLYKYYCSDLEGNPLLFVNGKPLAGARQVPVQAVIVTAPAGYGEVTNAGTNVLEVGESITLSTSDTTRHAIGFRVNGEDVLAGGTTWSFTATDTLPKAPICVEALYSTNWYVNANAADNSGNGFTPETAVRTFQGLFDKANILRGDCVHAAEGVYDDGEMDVTTYSKARVSIPAGVSVVADGEVEKTFIVGRASDDAPEFVDALGRGTNAVRCVYMRQGSARSVLRGFTLTGGRTCGDGSINSDNYGGGVLCHNFNPLIVDCIISNNAASRGGGCHLGTLVNCRLFWNYARNNRAAVSQSSCFNCIIDHNRGVNAAQNCTDMINCTFGPDNLKEDGSEETAGYSMPYGPTYNCLFLGKYEGTSTDPGKGKFIASDCVFNSKYRMTSASAYDYTNCTFVTDAELQVDADYRPILGTCAAINAASNVLSTAYADFPSVDVYGTQRIYNGRLDAGACEYDWRAKYAADLGNSALTVTEASPEVVEVEGKVRVPDGATLAIDWVRMVPQDFSAKFSFVAEPTGAGELTVARDEEACVPAVSGVNTFTSAAALNRLLFAYSGDEAGYADLSAFLQKSRGAVISFR